MRMTIAQHREKEVVRLAKYKSDNPSEDEISEARTVMNSYYRLCGLCEKNLILANDERTCNRRSTALSEAKEERWSKRLNDKLQSQYGLRLLWCGYLPHICEKNSTATAIERFFYD